MPWTHIQLNDGTNGDSYFVAIGVELISSAGTSIPSIAFGTWQRGNGQVGVDITEEALSVGFEHIGTLQILAKIQPAA